MPICTRCRIPVPENKLRLPDRCIDRKCPLNALAIAQRIEEERALAAASEQQRTERAA